MFSTTDISNGISEENNAKYRSDVKKAAIGSGLDDEGMRYKTITSGGCSGGGGDWVWCIGC